MRILPLTAAAVFTSVMYGQAGRATVVPETAQVLAKPAATAAHAGVLPRGDSVVITFKITGSDGLSWCEVQSETSKAVLGFVRCTDLVESPSSVESTASIGTGKERAAAAPSPADRQTDDLLNLSGLADQVRAMVNVEQIAISLAARGVPAADRMRMAQVLQRSISPDTFIAAVRESVRANYDAERMTETLEWYRSPIGQGLVRASAEANSPAKVQAFSRYLNERRVEHAKPERLQLARRIADACDLPNTAAMMARAIMRGFASRLNPMLPPDNRLTDAKMEAMVGQMRLDSGEMVGLFISRLLFTYEQTPDTDLRAYADFLQSPSGRWSTGVTARAGAAAVEVIAPNIVDELLRAAPKRAANPVRTR